MLKIFLDRKIFWIERILISNWKLVGLTLEGRVDDPPPIRVKIGLGQKILGVKQIFGLVGLHTKSKPPTFPGAGWLVLIGLKANLSPIN